MNKEQKQEVIEALKSKFSQYSNFYITDTQNLSVAQVTNLRRHCFDKHVEMKVAKNTLIKKALESLDNDRYSGVYDSLHQVTALMFSESPKEPALIISSFRKSLNGEKPVLKAAFLNGDVFVGDNQLVNLTKIKTKNELIGEVIGLLMSPIQRVIGALQNRPETLAPEQKTGPAAPGAEIDAPKVEATEATSATPAVAETKTETPKQEAKSEDAGPKAETPAAKAEEAKPAINEREPESSNAGDKIESSAPKATEAKGGPQAASSQTKPAATGSESETGKPEARSTDETQSPGTASSETAEGEIQPGA
jgi:large subunit ribosomal protein L10